MFPEPSKVMKYQDFRKKEINNINALIQGSEFSGLRLTTKVARHTFATAGRICNVNSEIIAEIMGHELLGQAIINIYKRPFDQDIKDKELSRILFD